MSKYIFFYEGFGYPQDVIKTHTKTLQAIENNEPMIHTLQMSELDFDLTHYNDYRIFIVFDQSVNPCKYPVVEFKVGCIINNKEMRLPHNLYKMYRSGAMYSSLDKFDQELMFTCIEEVLYGIRFRKAH